MPKIVGLGEALIDLFAEPGTPLKEAESLKPSPGGAPANVAVTLGRLGADVGFIGRVGNDEFGKLLQESLQLAGVDITHFQADPVAPTMLAVVASPRPTEQHFALYHGAAEKLSVDDLPKNVIESAQVFYFGSVSLANQSREATLKAAQWAKDAKHHVVFDVNLRPAVWADLDEAKRWIKSASKFATVIKMNESELRFLTGTNDLQQGCSALLEQNIQLCCVSLGGDGAYFDNHQVRGTVPVADVAVVDTTGSGDAFVGGFCFQLSRLSQSIAELDEATLRSMIQFANACGGLAATKLGAMSALPDLASVEALIQTISDS